jgi:hypothetical protein
MASKKERAQLYLRCALFGPSSGDKTMTALRMAKEIAEKTGVPITIIDIEKPGEEFGVALYEWLKGDTASVSKTATEIPTETPKEKPAEKPGETPAVKPASLAETGKAIIDEIKNILTSKSSDGVENFSEEEKEEARKIIRTVNINESGIQTLSDLKGLLSEELAKREAVLKKAA